MIGAEKFSLVSHRRSQKFVAARVKGLMKTGRPMPPQTPKKTIVPNQIVTAEFPSKR